MIYKQLLAFCVNCSSVVLLYRVSAQHCFNNGVDGSSQTSIDTCSNDFTLPLFNFE